MLQLHGYQEYSKNWIVEKPFCGLLLDMGLGKTASALAAVEELIKDRFEVSKALVVAPKRVAEQTWPEEIEKWGFDLKVKVIAGTAAQRKKALFEPIVIKKGFGKGTRGFRYESHSPDVYTIGRDNLAWLCTTLGSHWPFDMVILDELSSFKNHQSIRFKCLRLMRPKMKRVVGLTGTPTPNGLIDLWSQIYLLDQGERLGRTLGAYRQAYFTPGASNGHIVYNYKVQKGATDIVMDKLSDICVSMKAVDYLDVPERLDLVEWVDVDLEQYEEFEKEQVLELLRGQDTVEIAALSAAAMTNKLLQYANGAIYDSDKKWHAVHDAKLERLAELIEAANGQPVLIFYQFKHDLERGRKAVGGVVLEGKATIEAWNRQEIPILWTHAASAGHGLNLQYGGFINIWFGLGWSLELYQQAVARLHRQGQKQTVKNYMILAKGTMDQDVQKALDNKAKGQDAVMEAVKARIEKWSRK